MKPARGATLAKSTPRTATKVATKSKASVASPFPPVITTLPSLKLDPFRTKQALSKLASGEGAEELEAELDALGDYSAYEFFKVVMRSKHVAGSDRMEAAKQILPYEKAKPTPALEMSGRTVEDFARAIRASVKAIDDCIEQP